MMRNSRASRQAGLGGLIFLLGSGLTTSAVPSASQPIALVVHGGAGTIRRAELGAERETEYRAQLEEGLLTGYRILAAGGSSLDAVEAVVRIFEDSPLFNAGKGAVFTAAGTNELDAAIMDGDTLAAGAVAGVTTLKNPISAARAVMESSGHVMLAGRGAEEFAASLGLEMVDPRYFFTEERWQALQRRRTPQGPSPGADSSAAGPPPAGGFGTVGALALDRQGRLAAATSTGGLTNKRFGRIGDSPIIGAGTYADQSCAVSATGQGELFIRHTVARDVCARVQYLGQPLRQAAETLIHQVLAPGTGGLIALDRHGNLAMPFNTEGMYRGYVLADGKPVVEIYQD